MSTKTYYGTLILLALALFSACKKGTLAPERYQARINVTSSPLSDQLDIVFAGSTGSDSLKAGGNIYRDFEINGDDIATGKKVGFKAYRKGTAELVADTSFLLPKRAQMSFNLISNTALGLSGFFNGNTGVPQDSIRIRLRYIDNTTAKKFSKLEWYFYQSKSGSPYYDANENISVVMTMNAGQYGSDFNIPYYRKNNVTTTSVIARLKDLETAQFLSFSAAVAAFSTPIQSGGFSGAMKFNKGAYVFMTGTINDKAGGYYTITYTGQSL